MSVLVLSLFAGGCANPVAAPRIPVRVNATAIAPLAKGAAYRIVPLRETVDDSTLLYEETGRLVRAALAARGLYEAPSPDRAAFVVEVDFGMAPPRALPRASNASAPTTTPPPPRPGAPGEADVSQLRSPTRGPLEKHLVLTAHETNAAEGAEPRTLWRVELTITDLSNDLRKYLPLLAAVAAEQMGNDSGGTRTVTVAENDKTVAFLRQLK